MKKPEDKPGQSGEAGEPGEPGEGTKGGAGGVGGKGGTGGTTGGVGGRGGEGGRAGPMGPRGDRGPVNHLAVVGYVILCLAIAFAVYRNNTLARQGEEAKDGICALRHDLEVRVQATNELLDTDKDGTVSVAEEHGADIFGIPRDVIVQGRNNQQKTIDTLGFLDCS